MNDVDNHQEYLKQIAKGKTFDLYILLCRCLGRPSYHLRLLDEFYKVMKATVITRRLNENIPFFQREEMSSSLPRVCIAQDSRKALGKF